ncbi:MAG: DUF47 family protein [Limisphaerales bacterium]
MAILTNLFGESPFGALEAHGEKVHQAVRCLDLLFEHLGDGDHARLREVAEQIFTLETEADRMRNHLHELLARRALMSMKRDEFFRLLEHQDSMADRAEDIAATLTLRELYLPPGVVRPLAAFVERVLKNCELEAGIMAKLDLLVESSFGGRDAVTVSRLITELAEREDEVKPRQVELSRALLGANPPAPPVDTILWLDVIHFLAELSQCATRVAEGIRLTLQIKS